MRLDVTSLGYGWVMYRACCQGMKIMLSSLKGINGPSCDVLPGTGVQSLREHDERDMSRSVVTARKSEMMNLRQADCSIGQDCEPSGIPVREGWTHLVAVRLTHERMSFCSAVASRRDQHRLVSSSMSTPVCVKRERTFYEVVEEGRDQMEANVRQNAGNLVGGLGRYIP